MSSERDKIISFREAVMGRRHCEVEQMIKEQGLLPSHFNLSSAITNRDVEMVKILIKGGAIVSDAIQRVVVGTYNMEIIKILVANGGRFTITNVNDLADARKFDTLFEIFKLGAPMTPRCITRAIGNELIFNQLINLGCPMDPECYSTACADYSTPQKYISTLFDVGVCLPSCRAIREKILMYATVHRLDNISNWALENGAEWNPRGLSYIIKGCDPIGSIDKRIDLALSALRMGCSWDPSVLDYLIEKFKPVYLKRFIRQGYMPTTLNLEKAIMGYYIDSAAVLIRSGVVLIESHVRLSIRISCMYILKMLLDSKCPFGEESFKEACLNKNIEAIRLLVTVGGQRFPTSCIEINMGNDTTIIECIIEEKSLDIATIGEHAMTNAITHDHYNVVDYLLRNGYIPKEFDFLNAVTYQRIEAVKKMMKILSKSVTDKLLLLASAQTIQHLYEQRVFVPSAVWMTKHMHSCIRQNSDEISLHEYMFERGHYIDVNLLAELFGASRVDMLTCAIPENFINPAYRLWIRLINVMSQPPTKHDCSICLEDIGSFVPMPCDHHFHYTCIKKWMVDKDEPTCPNCRVKL